MQNVNVDENLYEMWKNFEVNNVKTREMENLNVNVGGWRRKTPMEEWNGKMWNMCDVWLFGVWSMKV